MRSVELHAPLATPPDFEDYAFTMAYLHTSSPFQPGILLADFQNRASGVGFALRRMHNSTSSSCMFQGERKL